MAVQRQTVELSAYPQLVVIYLGMRVNRWTGLKTLFGFGPQISKSVDDRPAGLLAHEFMLYSLFPMHLMMRQYWRDLETLQSWTRSEPHRVWWKTFLRDSGGTGFWHETYLREGGVEAIYDDIPQPIGLGKFAPLVEARGPMFSLAHRTARPETIAPVVAEAELYPGG